MEFTQYETVRSFAAMWANATLRQAARYREAEAVAERKLWQYDRIEDWNPPWPEVEEAVDAAWAEGHLLVVAAHKLDAWLRRRAREGEAAEETGEDALLNDLRDALEHLDEALFEDGEPIPDRAKRKRWALDHLPRTPGSASQTRQGELLAFGLVNVDHLETTAKRALADIYDEIEAPAIDAYIQAEIDRQLGK